MLRLLLASVLVLCYSVASYSQTNLPDLTSHPEAIGPGPTAAGLGAHANVPVNHYTGLPNIGVPLYSISDGPITVPIGLSYRADGIQVNEQASWVGLGWSLAAGGVISRTVKGLPDDAEFGWGSRYYPSPSSGLEEYTWPGYLNYGGQPIDEGTPADAVATRELLDKQASGTADGEPDLFSFSVGGYSGQFVFGAGMVIHQLKQSDLKIEYTANVFELQTFTITTPNGMVYHFAEKETTTYITLGDDDVDQTPTHNNHDLTKSNLNSQPYTSAWYLSHITAPWANRQVTCNYTTETFSYTNNMSRKYGSTSTGNSKDLRTHQVFTMEHPRITSITWSTGSVYFDATVDRPTFPLGGITRTYNNAGIATSFSYGTASGYAKALSKIRILNADGQPVAGYSLAYGFHSEKGGGQRLKLESITELGRDLVSAKPPYVFSYNTQQLPPWHSHEVDYWGYYNANGATTSKPALWEYATNASTNATYRSRYSIFPRDGITAVVTGNTDRYANATAAQAGILTSVQYPTGGTDTFEYELHKFLLVNTEREGGGLRIKRVTRNFANTEGAENTVREFAYDQYLNNSTVSSGILVRVPAFAYSRGTGNNAYTMYFSRAQVVGATHGSPVGYTQVSEVQPGNGRTVYEYDFAAPLGAQKFDGTSTDFHGAASCDWQRSVSRLYNVAGNNSSVSYDDNFPFPDDPNYDWHRGTLAGTQVFDENNNLVQRTEYEYTVTDACVKIPTRKVGYFHRGAYDLNSGQALIDPAMMFANSYLLSTRKQLTKTTSRIYDRDFSGNHIATSTEYHYDSPHHLQATRVVTTNSDNRELTTELRYPQDFSYTQSGVMKDALDALIAEHRIATPIEVLRWQNKGTGNELLGANFVSWKQANNGKTLPYDTYTFETDVPIPQGSVLNSATQTSFQLDARYRQTMRMDVYDANSNLLQGTPAYAEGANMVYGHSNTLPIASITNATVAESGFTSYESNDTDLWNFSNGHTQVVNDAHTGSKCIKILPLSGTTNGGWRNFIPDDPDGQYVLSAWVKTEPGFIANGGKLVLHSASVSGNNAVFPSVAEADVTVSFSHTNGEWQYVETTIDLAAVQAAYGSQGVLKMHAYVANSDPNHYVLADDVRFHPKDAYMSTITWEQLVGPTSSTGSNQEPVFTDYDVFNRNSTVSDADGNVRQAYSYAFHTESIGHNRVASSVPQVAVTNLSALYALPTTSKWEQFSYFDGFGRTKQQVSRASTPSGHDMVAPVQYDAHGRVPKQHMPYEAGTSDGSYHAAFDVEQSNFYANAPARTPRTTVPFSETVFDASPMRMPLEQSAPGSEWQLGTGHTQGATYRGNTATEVRQWQLVSNKLKSTAYWPAYSLMVQKGTDEHGVDSYSYSDKLGRTILTKTLLDDANGARYAETYFYYDDFGNLTHVIPPQAITEMAASGQWDVSTLAHPLVYEYAYDERQRMVEQTVPGALPVLVVYDVLNRPIMTQDGVQRQKKEWSYSKYDVHGRPVYSGLVVNTNYISRASMQAAADAAANTSGVLFETPTNVDTDVLFGYTNNAFPVLGITVLNVGTKVHKTPLFDMLSVSYYDHHDVDRDGTADYTWTDALSVGTAASPTATSAVGRLTGNRVKVLDDNHLVQWLHTGVFYDRFGRGVQVSGNNHLGGTESAHMAYNFAGQTTETLLTHSDGLGNGTTIANRFEYDHAGRASKVFQQFNNDPEILLSAAGYNALGALVEKGLHSTNGGSTWLQSVDFTFNIRGWLTNINNANLENDRVRTLDQLRVDLYERLNDPNAPDGMVMALEVKTTDGNGVQELYTREAMALPLTGSDPLDYAELKTLNGATLTMAFVQQVIKDQATLDAAHDAAELAIVAKLNTNSVTRLGSVNPCKYQVCDFVIHTFTRAYGWTNDDANDLFGMDFKYTTVSPDLKADPLYNGNLAEVHWQSASDKIKRGYGYQYDKANRLLEAQYAEFNNGTQTWINGANRFNVFGIQYDDNGNIMSLQRNGYRQDATFGNMDNLVYKYDGNRLTQVNDLAATHSYNDFKDAGATSGTEFYYDNNGNQVYDANKRITIKYNHLNLPTTVLFSTGNRITYRYAADGRRLTKTVTPSGGTPSNTDYSGAFVYNDSGLEFVFTSEGRAVPDNGVFRYEYQFKDHLGNTRLAFSDLNGDGVADATSEIIQEQHYYPFGLEMLGLSTPQVGVEHKFKFNEAELQSEFDLQWYSMPFRQFDAQLGRWTGMDQIFKLHESPYAGFANNPIWFTDPLGLDTADFLMMQGSNVLAGFVLPEVNVFAYEPVSEAMQAQVANGPSILGAGLSIDGNGETYDVLSMEEEFMLQLINDEIAWSQVDYSTGRIAPPSSVPIDQLVNREIMMPAPPGQEAGSLLPWFVKVDAEGFPVGGIYKEFRPYGGTPPDLLGGGGAIGLTRKIAKVANVVSHVKKDAAILKLARQTFKGSSLLRKEANGLIRQLNAGSLNPGIGTKYIGKNIFEARSRGGARVYFRNGESAIDILGYSNKANQQAVINRLMTIH